MLDVTSLNIQYHAVKNGKLTKTKCTKSFCKMKCDVDEFFMQDFEWSHGKKEDAENDKFFESLTKTCKPQEGFEFKTTVSHHLRDLLSLNEKESRKNFNIKRITGGTDGVYIDSQHSVECDKLLESNKFEEALNILRTFHKAGIDAKKHSLNLQPMICKLIGMSLVNANPPIIFHICGSKNQANAFTLIENNCIHCIKAPNKIIFECLNQVIANNKTRCSIKKLSNLIAHRTGFSRK